MTLLAKKKKEKINSVTWFITEKNDLAFYLQLLKTLLPYSSFFTRYCSDPGLVVVFCGFVLISFCLAQKIFDILIFSFFPSLRFVISDPTAEMVLTKPTALNPSVHLAEVTYVAGTWTILHG